MFESTLALALFTDIGGGEIVIIGVIALLLFGKNLPTVTRNFGRAFAEFKKTVSDASSEIKKEMDAAALEMEKATREAEKELPKASDFTLDDGPGSTAPASARPEAKKPIIGTSANGNGSTPELAGPLNRPVASNASGLDTFKPDTQPARPSVIQ